MAESLFERHQVRLGTARKALLDRGYWSAFPETPSGKIYGAAAAEEGERAFRAARGQEFDLADGWAGERVGAEVSPFDGDLGIRYPARKPGELVAAAGSARAAWRDAGPRCRLGICLEILDRLNKRSFEMAHAVMHTTGQGFVMAFQAGGPHAQDRGLEALAMAYDLMMRTPESARFEKPLGRGKVESFDKEFVVAGRGVGLVIGCSTFPTWNSYGAIFANLACGNPTIVKPHPKAVLPLALTVQVAHEVLREQGLPLAIVQLAVDGPGSEIAKELASDPAVRLIDYTGSNAFGDWLLTHCRQAVLFAEKAGVNPVLVHSTSNYEALLRNLAFSLCLYSGQMCTTPQNIHLSDAGIQTDRGLRPPAEFAKDLATAIDDLLSDPERASEILGMVGNRAVADRIEAAKSWGAVVRPSVAVAHPKYSGARARSPILLLVDDACEAAKEEQFGPIAFIIASSDPLAGIKRGLEEKGAITFAVYAEDETVMGRARAVALDGGVALSENLLGGTFVNQSAAFSDFHATGLNPAANASLTDEAFVAPRFAVVQRRRPSA